MKLLITGGAGFIGSNFIHYWTKKHPKDKVRVIDALTYAGNRKNLEPVKRKIEFVEADITDKGKVKEAMKGVDAVVHFAAETHVERSILDPAVFWKTNVLGTQMLLEEAKKAKVPRFHHVSTDEVYGELELDSDERFSEKTPYAPRPDNLYAISKAEADRVVREFAQGNKMHITISNCSNNFGPYEFPEKYIPILITNLIDGYKVPVHGDGLNVRDWIHTEDHAKAIDLILSKGKEGETYLIGSENDVPNKEIAERVVRLYGKDPTWVKYVPDRHSNDRRYAIDPTKIYTELGWKPTITKENFDEGLSETIDWYKKSEDWWRPLLKRKAPVTNGEKKAFAFITLDREVGKVKFEYKYADEDTDKKPVLGRKMMEDKVRTGLIKTKLKTRQWYKNTSKTYRDRLLALAKDPKTQGFVDDLAGRPDVIGSVKQLKLIRLAHAPQKYGIYGIAAWFQVETVDGEKKVEGYYSWAMGTKSGAKLLVLTRYKGRISHIALLKSEKFPIGARVYDLAGGFPNLDESVFELITRKLKDELGIEATNSTMRIGEIIGLGRVMPDAGMTNNHPYLYAVIVDVDEKIFPPLNEGENYETDKGLVLWPIEKLSELINKVDDAYFLSALARLKLGGLTNIKF